MHPAGEDRLALQVVAARRPDREDERQTRPLLPQGAQVVHLQAEAGPVDHVRAQGRVADEDGGLGLPHHQAEVGRAGVVVRLDAVALGEEQLGEADGGAGGRPEGDAGAVEPVQGDLRDDHAGHDRAVAADGDVGEGDQVVGVLEELDQGDRTDVEIALHQLLAELLRSVLGELEVEERARSGEPPVQGQAVQELDVADARPGARSVHIVRLALTAYGPARDPRRRRATGGHAPSPPVGRGCSNIRVT